MSAQTLSARQLMAAAAVVAGGAALGALARWLVGAGFSTPDQAWPWALWWINVIGAALLGVVTGAPAMAERPLLAAACGPGLLGGFTSVSAAAEEVRRMLAEGQLLLAATWWGSMLVASVAVVVCVRRCLPRPLTGRAAHTSPEPGAGSGTGPGMRR